MTSPTVRPSFQAVAEALQCRRATCGCHRAGRAKRRVHCPAHDDEHPTFDIEDRAGTVLMICRAGCTQEHVLDALRARGLWPEPAASAPAKARRRIVVTYPYRDEHGTLLFQVVRFDPKGFAQRRPGANGGWSWNVEGVRRVPYRLPELLAAKARGERVFVTEGEKDADRLASLGLAATTNPGGAGKWREEEYTPHFAGAEVVILPDNDEPGERHAEQVARALYGTAASVKVLRLPGLALKGDVADWLDAGHTAQDLQQLVAETAPWSPPAAHAEAPAGTATGRPQVDGRRGSSKPREQDRKGIELPENAPWDAPVDGATLREDLEDFFRRYVIGPIGASVVVAIWIVCTYVLDAFDTFPLLAVTSAEKQSGKTRTLEVIERLARRALRAAGISLAALYRLVEQVCPTLLIDEAQRLRDRDEHSAAEHDHLCSSYRRGAPVYRVGGPNHDTLQSFQVFGPKVLACIGSLSDVLADRAIEIRMRRRLPAEAVEPFYFARAEAQAAPLRRQLVRWGQDHVADVAEAYRDLRLPGWLRDRDAELWAPLFAAGVLLDPTSIPRLEEAARLLTGAKGENVTASAGVRLLSDIRVVFDAARQEALHTADLLQALHALDESPWAEWKRGRPLSGAGLAALLRPYGIRSGQIWADGSNRNGYKREAFTDAFARYLVSSPASDLSGDPRNSRSLDANQDGGFGDFQDSRPEGSLESEERLEARRDADSRLLEFHKPLEGVGEDTTPSRAVPPPSDPVDAELDEWLAALREAKASRGNGEARSPDTAAARPDASGPREASR